MTRGSMLALAVAAVVSACAAVPDPGVRAGKQDDARCRHFGAVPQTETYVDCRLRLLTERDRAFAAASSAPQPPPSRLPPPFSRKAYPPIPPN